MSRIRLDDAKLSLRVSSKILKLSFRGLKPAQRQRLGASASSSDSQGLKRTIWEKQDQGVTMAFETGGGEATLSSRAGITDFPVREKASKSFFLVFGWKDRGGSRQFSSNVLTEMNAATNGVTMYCAKPKRKLMIGALADEQILKHYLRL